MRIVIDMQGLQTSSSAHRGVGRYTQNLVMALLALDRGHEFYLAMNGAFPESAVRIRALYSDLIPNDHMRVWEQSFEISPAPSHPALTRAAEILRETFLNSLKPDIIFSTNLQEGFAEPACTSVKRVNSSAIYCSTLHDVVPMYHTDYLKEDSIRTWYIEKLEHAKNSDILITVSHSSKSDIVKKILVPEEVIHVIENGYDESRFNPKPVMDSRKIALKSKYGISGDFILYYGGADSHKNLIRLIQAFELMKSTNRKSISLVLAGRDVAGDRAVQDALAASSVSDAVLTPGFVEDDDLPELIKCAKAFVFPSLNEGFGLPALEAMACGTPVIGSAQSSVAEIINNTSATFDPQNIYDISTKISNVLHDDNLRSNLINHGLKQAKRYSWRQSAENLLDIFESYARSRSTPVALQTDPTADFLDNFQDIAQPFNYTDLVELAKSVADTFPPARRKKLFLDISAVISVDDRSGIQRVTRAIFMELLRRPPHEFDIETVYTNRDDLNFYIANRYLRRNLIVRPSDVDQYVEFSCDDILVYLDLNPGVTIAHRAYNQKLRAKGVKVYHVVYDLIPILKPETFVPDVCREFEKWLETVSTSDGALCISKSVASDLNDYIARFGEQRDHKFHIGWFHLGADIENSIPTKGFPSNSECVFSAIGAQTTFLMVGTLEPRKGHLQVLAAFDQLWASGLDVAVVMFGRVGWLMDDLIVKIKNHKEFEKRLFLITGGSDEYLKAIYKKCDCLIAASDAEGFGLPLIEAAQHGIPIIARDIPVFREVAGPYASYFENGAEPSLVARSVAAWLSDREKKQIPSSAEMPWLTWRQSAAQMLDVIREQRWTYQTLGGGALRRFSRQDHRSRRFDWKGFGPPESDRRWSSSAQASISFNWGGPTGPSQLRLEISTQGRQRVKIELNGAPVFSDDVEGQKLTLPVALPTLIDGANVVAFSLPDARSSGGGDPRVLAIAIHSVMIEPPPTPSEGEADRAPKNQAMDWIKRRRKQLPPGRRA